MGKDFQLWKKQALSKIDKSPKGTIDEKVLSLCSTINRREDMFTLSTCSGRVIFLETMGSKKGTSFYFSSHDIVDIEKPWKKLSEYHSKNKLYFRFEGCILHICVDSVELGHRLIVLAKECGFNTAGIISAKRKIVVELIDDNSVIFPLFDSKVLISKDFFEISVKESNSGLKKTWDKINRLEQSISKI